MSELVFSDELEVHTNGAGEGYPGKVVSKRKNWNRAERGKGSPGEAGRKGCTTSAQQLGCLSRGRSSAAGAGAGVAAAAQPPASAKGTEEARCAPILLAGKRLFPAETVFHDG